MQNYNRSF